MSYSQQGPAAQVLQLINVDLPQPGPGQVRVQIAYSAVNPTDVKTRSGMTGQAMEQPQIPHMDGSGIIDAVGEGVSPSRIGERVWLMLVAFGSTWGTAAEAIIVDSARAIELPAHITLKHAATIAVPSLTAAYCLFNDGCLFRDGSLTDRNVLIQGGAGGVGRAAIQLAALGGARVYATASTPAKQEIARTAGAHLVVDYRDPQAAEQILVASGGIDRIIELNLGVNLELDLAVIRTGSSIVTYAADATDPQIPVRRLMMACVDLRFMILYNITPGELANAIEIVSSALERRAVTIPPTRVFALEECVDAHVAQEAGPDSRLLLLVNELE